MSAAAQDARDKYNTAHTSLSEKQGQQTELQGFLGLDFGPDDAWLPLHNKCFDTRVSSSSPPPPPFPFPLADEMTVMWVHSKSTPSPSLTSS